MNTGETENNQINDQLETEQSLFGEFWTFLMENKIWWLTPMCVFLALAIVFVGWAVVFGTGPGAPFIYSLF